MKDTKKNESITAELKSVCMTLGGLFGGSLHSDAAIAVDGEADAMSLIGLIGRATGARVKVAYPASFLVRAIVAEGFDITLTGKSVSYMKGEKKSVFGEVLKSLPLPSDMHTGALSRYVSVVRAISTAVEIGASYSTAVACIDSDTYSGLMKWAREDAGELRDVLKSASVQEIKTALKITSGRKLARGKASEISVDPATMAQNTPTSPDVDPAVQALKKVEGEELHEDTAPKGTTASSHKTDESAKATVKPLTPTERVKGAIQVLREALVESLDLAWPLMRTLNAEIASIARAKNVARAKKAGGPVITASAAN